MAEAHMSPALDQRQIDHLCPLDSVLEALDESDCDTCQTYLTGLKAHLETSIPAEGATVPIAYCTVTPSSRSDSWVIHVPSCPHCHRPHQHGGGPLTGPKRLGWRTPHCTDKDLQPRGLLARNMPEYQLVELEENRS